MKNYLIRNQRWLKPIFGGFMIVASTLMFKTMESETANVIPQWLPAIGIIVAGFGAGFGAMFTNTTSAYIVRFVGTAAGFAVILHTIFQ